MGKEESTTVFMKEWAKEPTVISLKLSKNIIENFSHTPNLQLSGEILRAKFFQ
jgi:hypothetical protein